MDVAEVYTTETANIANNPWLIISVLIMCRLILGFALTAKYLFSGWRHATLCGVLEGPPGHCGLSTQSKCRCQSSDKSEKKLFAIHLGVFNPCYLIVPINGENLMCEW